MKNRFVLYVIFLVLVSCKSTRTIYDRHGELKNITDLRLIKSISDNYLEYNTIFFKKFKAGIEINGENKSFKGNIYLNRDSSVVISINPLIGIELLRVRLSNNNVEILDRTKRDYLKGSYEYLWEKFMLELDFKTIHSILTNELFVYPPDIDEIDALKKYKHDVSDDLYVFQSLKQGRAQRIERKGVKKELVLHEFYILPEVFKVNRTYIKDFNSNGVVDISYDDFFEVRNGLFPGKMKVSGIRGLNKFIIELKFDDIEFDSTNSLGFKISDKYSKKTL
ncbi:DUF4292 domain-containing protein [Carboxylicivirga caseinilyticus]|uniref:DUF4292 domain-containing protein n=1 Tax=Carboxylicivirga caseinilyticus TaxID=3417572 RepID=UPI003D336DB3|nr:DUF4292 domain-containing protein [Marinilabiliaceae bacterium A049]